MMYGSVIVLSWSYVLYVCMAGRGGAGRDRVGRGEGYMLIRAALSV